MGRRTTLTKTQNIRKKLSFLSSFMPLSCNMYTHVLMPAVYARNVQILTKTPILISIAFLLNFRNRKKREKKERQRKERKKEHDTFPRITQSSSQRFSENGTCRIDQTPLSSRAAFRFSFGRIEPPLFALRCEVSSAGD